MPRISLNLDVPQSDWDELEEVRRAEGVKSVRALLIWCMRAGVAERAARARKLEVPEPSESAA